MIDRLGQRNPLLGLQQESVPVVMIGLLLLGTALGLVSELLPNPQHLGAVCTLLLIGVLASWALVGRSHVIGVWLLVSICVATTLLAEQLYPAYAPISLLVIPTGLATLMIGRRSGLLTAVLVSLLVIQVAAPAAQIVPLLLIWAVYGLILFAVQFAERASWWALSSHTRMFRLLEEARDQSLELKQTQEDLIGMNLQLLRLTERLEAMRGFAEDARRTKEEFVANVSHELRTPLNMIIGFSDMITQSPQMYHTELPPALLADLAVIQRNSQHLAKLVDDVLDLSQIEAGQLALSKDWANAREIVEAAYVAVKPLFAAKGLYLHMDVPATTPMLFCDSTRLRQVLLNLLSNAGRFTEEGGVCLRMSVEQNRMVISVADTGPGISAEDQVRIFEPFQQVDGSLRRRFDGNGLGLCISKRFVELHHGKIWLESELGKGTTVFVSIPLGHKSLERPSNAARWVDRYHIYEPRTRQSKAPVLVAPPRLVVLESGNILTRLLTRYCQGTEIVALRTFEDARLELERSPAQALIVNDASAGCAAEIAQQAQALPYGTPVIACWMPGEEHVAEQLGVQHYLIKPVTRPTLLSVLDEIEDRTAGKRVKTILVVDDDADALQFFARILLAAERGYRVLRASDGHHALALLRERKPDLMLLDLLMPGMDGYTVLQKKNQDSQICEIPVIVISASDPLEEPIMTSFLTATRSRGIAFRDLTTFIEAFCDLAPHPAPSVDPVQRESVPG